MLASIRLYSLRMPGRRRVQMASGAAARKAGGVCADQATLASEIAAEGAGKCMPAFAKTRDSTGRRSCGPERSWPPDRVTSRLTTVMPAVSVDQLRARLVVRAPRQVPPNPTELRLIPGQRKRQAAAGQPWVEPLVRPQNVPTGSRPSDHYFRSVCLSVCLFV